MLTLGQLKEATCSKSTYASKFLPYVIDTCDKFSINTPSRMLNFLAQVGHESGGLFYTEELASGSAYEGRADLGNTQKGDGIKFKGRGLIQITGRANYKAVSAALGTDFILNLTLLGGKNVTKCSDVQLKNAAASAGWFWNNRKLNALADQIDIIKSIDAGNNLVVFKKITKVINGGYNGLLDRLNRYKAGLSYFL
ncbi:glycoside hydrolase family 19 protein [Chryseobacterium sp. JJR-5R]|uniref:glycoside hydrolase family 19 protein n=1 Tax=Chryseobacterium sp. JJR-5R TaxID=3093923 RepID=UPI002A75F445|nr:glycoside hydrolase family 19 protein [Chryseobacterium sp. JJR-5R]WPO82549.1 glycoside hydrolase family 19 protein [Chryseobacterium sp. JJR-5R]